MIKNSSFLQKVRPSPSKQSGVILIIAVVALLAITLFVLGGLNLSNSQFQVINNYSEQKRAENAAKEVIEMVVNSQELFTSVINNTVEDLQNCESTSPPPFCKYTASGGDDFGDEYNIQLLIPHCYGTTKADGYSAVSGMAPEDSHWEITAIATSKKTGTRVTLTEGVKIRFGAGNCDGSAVSSGGT